MQSDDTQRLHDYLILGAGPAGLQLGYFLQQAGRDYLILEAGDAPGTFFRTFPRHRRLISINKVYTGYDDPEVNLRWDWNSLLSDDETMRFSRYSEEYFPAAQDLCRYLSDFALRFCLNVRYTARVERVWRDGFFTVEDQEGNLFRTRRLIVATGVSKPNLPVIPGIELAELYGEVSTDPKDFVNQRVLILGKGNSAFETADNLIGTAALIHVASPNPVTLAWKSHFVGHLRAVNNNLLDTYQLKAQNAILDTTVERIERKDGKLVAYCRYTHGSGEQLVQVYDRAVVCTGFRFDDALFDESCRPPLAISGRFPEQTPCWESTSVPDMYFAGTLMQSRDFKKCTSAFIHGFRYNVRALHRILELKYHGREWPSTPISARPEALTDAVLRRLNGSSALWQQFGFLCDLIVLPEQGDRASYYEELPMDYVLQGEIGGAEDCYTITLEFGKITGDPFAIERNPDPTVADQSTLLHPVIRRFRRRQLVAEQHLLEDLYGEWRKPVDHIVPLQNFFECQKNPVLV